MYFIQGHGQYLLYIMSFSNFILIFYRLAIEQVPMLEAFFSSLTVFAMVFLPAYVAAAMIIGRWHVRTQLATVAVVSAHYNPPIKKILENQEEILKRLKKFEKERDTNS